MEINCKIELLRLLNISCFQNLFQMLISIFIILDLPTKAYLVCVCVSNLEQFHFLCTKALCHYFLCLTRNFLSVNHFSLSSQQRIALLQVIKEFIKEHGGVAYGCESRRKCVESASLMEQLLASSKICDMWLLYSQALSKILGVIFHLNHISLCAIKCSLFLLINYVIL